MRKLATLLIALVLFSCSEDSMDIPVEKSFTEKYQGYIFPFNGIFGQATTVYLDFRDGLDAVSYNKHVDPSCMDTSVEVIEESSNSIELEVSYTLPSNDHEYLFYVKIETNTLYENAEPRGTISVLGTRTNKTGSLSTVSQTPCD